jgi:16S rRNA processing protein RimM
MVEGAPSPTPKPDRVDLRVARLVKAHGLKGGLKLELYTDDPELRFRPGAVLALQVPQDSVWFGKALTVLSVREINSHPVVFFEGVEDRDTAESLVKAILWVEHDPAVRPQEPDAWFDHQLVGLAVKRAGATIGTVVRVEHFPAQDLLVINTGEAEVLVPFVSEFVPVVDSEQGFVEVTPPGGLFEALEEQETS